jgi:hypothetical protein
MKVIIDYNGKTYESVESDQTIDALYSQLYGNLEDFVKFSMDLPGGGKLILPKETLLRCVIQLIP